MYDFKVPKLLEIGQTNSSYDSYYIRTSAMSQLSGLGLVAILLFRVFHTVRCPA